MTQEVYTLPIFKTEDYTIFQKLDGNRTLYPKHIKRLVKVIELDKDFTKNNPIKVNEKLEIIDGQHRVAAFEEYKKLFKESPYIYYIKIEGLTLDDARKMNAGTKAWNPMDYALAYAEEGNVNYKIYLDFLREFELNHHVLMSYLQDSPTHQSLPFQIGKFIIKNEAKARKGLSLLREIGQFYSKWSSQHFANSFLKILNSPKYNHERMLVQMEKYSDGLNNIPNRIKETLPAINMIYNWQREDTVDLLS